MVADVDRTGETTKAEYEHSGGEQRLIELWEQIDVLLNRALPRAGVLQSLALRRAIADPASLPIIDEWRITFEREISTLRLARNSVAHASDISEENVASGVRIAERLLDALERRLLTEAGRRQGS